MGLAALVLAYLYLDRLAPLVLSRARSVDFDEAIFRDVAHSIATTGLPIRHVAVPTPVFFFDHTPLLVYAVAILDRLGLDPLLAGRTISAMFGLAMVLGIYALVRGWQGLLAACLVIASPLVMTYAWFLRMEVPMACCLVVAIAMLSRQQWLGAGIAVAVAVMLKEVALAFLVIVGGVVLWRFGRRAGARFAAASVVALAAWFAYAAWLDSHQLGFELRRWATANDGGFVRTAGGPEGWALALWSWLGPLLVVAVPLAALVARGQGSWLAHALLGYSVVAIAASFAMFTKEPRWVIGVVPAAALATGWLLRRGAMKGRPGTVTEWTHSPNARSRGTPWAEALIVQEALPHDP